MRVSLPRSWAMAVLATLGLLTVGCSRGPQFHDVSGTVTYRGKPLPAGVIYFNPDVQRGNDGPQGYAIIKDGEYTTATAGGKGVLGGAYVVRIEGFDGKPGNELPLGKPMFTDFQTAVDFPESATTKDFDVPVVKKKK